MENSPKEQQTAQEIIKLIVKIHSLWQQSETLHELKSYNLILILNNFDICHELDYGEYGTHPHIWAILEDS